MRFGPLPTHVLNWVTCLVSTARNVTSWIIADSSTCTLRVRDSLSLILLTASRLPYCMAFAIISACLSSMSRNFWANVSSVRAPCVSKIAEHSQLLAASIGPFFLLVCTQCFMVSLVLLVCTRSNAKSSPRVTSV